MAASCVEILSSWNRTYKAQLNFGTFWNCDYVIFQNSHKSISMLIRLGSNRNHGANKRAVFKSLVNLGKCKLRRTLNQKRHFSNFFTFFNHFLKNHPIGLKSSRRFVLDDFKLTSESEGSSSFFFYLRFFDKVSQRKNLGRKWFTTFWRANVVLRLKITVRTGVWGK